MIKLTKITALLLLLSGMFFATANAGWDPRTEDKARESVEYFKKNAPALSRFFEKAYGYAVFADVYKGGLMLFGGGHGNGYVFELNNFVGRSSITQLSVGPQLGGQSFSEIIFFKDKENLDSFKKGNFELNALQSGHSIQNSPS